MDELLSILVIIFSAIPIALVSVISMTTQALRKESMRKCEKTVTGKHRWKFKSITGRDKFGKIFLAICDGCGIIDDRKE